MRFIDRSSLLQPLLLVSATLACSCSSSDDSEWVNDFVDSDFERVELSSSQGERLDFLNDSLGRPLIMKSIDHGFLAISDSKTDKMLWLVDVGNERARNFVSQGEGPDEMLYLGSISYLDGILSLGGSQNGRFWTLRSAMIRWT